MPVINTSQADFTANEQITSSKLNNILDQSIFVSGSTGGAVADGTLEVVGGQLKVKTIGTANIGDAQIVTLKIADANVTPAKLSIGRIDWNDWTTDGSKVSTTILAYGRTTSQAGTTNLDFRASDASVNTAYDARISRASGAVGILTIDNVYDTADTTTATRGQIDFKINGTAKMSIKQDGTILFGTTPLGAQTGTAPIYGARAWVNFDATTALSPAVTGSYTRATTTTTVVCAGHGLKAGSSVYLDFGGTGGPADGIYTITAVTTTTVADDTFTVTTATGTNATPQTVTLPRWTIKGSGNVSSVSNLGTGLAAINFTTQMPSANYAFSGYAQFPSTSPQGLITNPNTVSQTIWSAKITTVNSTSNSENNCPAVHVIFYN